MKALFAGTSGLAAAWLVGVGLLAGGVEQSGDLNSPDPQQRYRARSAIMEAVNEWTTEALAILQADKSELRVDDPRIGAMEVLGYLRSREAVGILIELLEFPNPEHVEEAFWKGERVIFKYFGDVYPAAGALARIGATRACVTELGDSTGRRRDILLAVIKMTEGEHAAARIRLLLEETKDPARRQNIKDALRRLEERFEPEAGDHR